MADAISLIKESIPDQKGANALMSKLLDAARPEAIFGEPVTLGAYTAITASEVSVGLGYGFGGGGGVGPGSEEEETGTKTSEPVGYGSGGGGGGASSGRPVAVVEIGPNGVRVEPVVDPTKIALAFFTTFGAMLMMFGKMKKAAKD